MYGVIYVAIKDYALEKLGPEKWETVLADSGVTVDFTATEQPYNDEITHTLATAIANAEGRPLNDVLYDIGYQVIMTTNLKFKNIISARGETFREYLINLPNYHNRISLIYPELTPPEFRITGIEEKSMVLHYRKRRPGMLQYVNGYVHALASLFKEDVTIAATPDNDNNTELIFNINW